MHQFGQEVIEESKKPADKLAVETAEPILPDSVGAIPSLCALVVKLTRILVSVGLSPKRVLLVMVLMLTIPIA
jgi:hypothetical protein